MAGKPGAAALQRGLLDSIPLPVFIKDLDGRYADCNQRFCDFVGRPRAGIVGRTPFDIAPRELAEAYQQFDRTVRRTGDCLVYDGKINTAEGGVRDVVCHKSVLTDDDGNEIGILGVIRDVTDERAGARRLKESEARFARLAELTREGVVLHKDGLVLDVNEAFCRMTGWARDALIGREYSLLIAPECLGEARRHVRDRSDAPYRLMMLRCDGEPFPAEAHGRNLTYGGEELRVVAVTDITQRLAAEQAVAERELLYREMFETNTAVKLLIDPASGAIVDANPSAARFYGWSREELRGMRITDINALAPEAVHAEMASARAEERLYFRFPHRLASGELRSVEVYSGPVTFHDRILLHSIIHDVTERERAQADLQRSNADLQQFAYVASHDLQEPLRTVVSYLQLLERRYQGRLDADADEFIGFAVDAAKRMSALIHDLLTYSRVETQGRPLAPVAVETALAAATANLHFLAETWGARIDAGPMPVVQGDLVQLSSVFQNLLGNAIKYRAKDRPPVVRVTAEPMDGAWLFRVADNGIGIASQYHERVFKIFQRLHTQAQYDGTGIGLALVRRIVTRHGGRVWIESEEGQGTTVCFTLKGADVTPPAASP